jgi:hypothetical protein
MLVIIPNTTYWFQWSLEILYKLLNIIGNTILEFSSIKLIMYSLFQKYKALSAT